VIDHLSTYATDYEATRRFYAAALAALGHGLQTEAVATWNAGFPTQRMCAFGPPRRLVFWIIEERAAATPRHLAFTAADRESVIAFHRAGLAAGGIDNGAPGLRPRYHANYFGAFLLDPDGNNVEAVCHARQAGS
jgi:catechol 2,3-dioxygenase-like lactoylglutathione lyase family enzyme